MTEQNGKHIPEYTSTLRSRSVLVPPEIRKASGIRIFGTRLKSLIFTSDVAVIQNCNADAVMCVYPFSPSLTITQAVLDVAKSPVMVGVGGGLTTGERLLNLALQAELLGAFGVVVNAPIQAGLIRRATEVLAIPLVATVASAQDDFLEKIAAGADMLNVSGGRDTVALVRAIRNAVPKDYPIIATGGPTPESILATIEAGANAITYTPPSSAEIFRGVMEVYRRPGAR